MSRRNPFGWEYPAGAANDPRAPWNQDDSHCRCCPCHDDSSWNPYCSECDGGTHGLKGTCYLFELLPEKLARWLAQFSLLGGLYDKACTWIEEPPCDCDGCTCYEDAREAAADAEYQRRKEEGLL